MMGLFFSLLLCVLYIGAILYHGYLLACMVACCDALVSASHHDSLGFHMLVVSPMGCEQVIQTSSLMRAVEIHGSCHHPRAEVNAYVQPWMPMRTQASTQPS